MGKAQLWSNPASMHLTLTAAILVEELEEGTRNIVVRSNPDTRTNNEDYFSLVALDLGAP